MTPLKVLSSRAQANDRAIAMLVLNNSYISIFLLRKTVRTFFWRLKLPQNKRKTENVPSLSSYADQRLAISKAPLKILLKAYNKLNSGACPVFFRGGGVTLCQTEATMAFTANISSRRLRHLNIVGCLLIKKPTKRGGTGTPGAPSSSYVLVILLHFRLREPQFLAF